MRGYAPYPTAFSCLQQQPPLSVGIGYLDVGLSSLIASSPQRQAYPNLAVFSTMSSVPPRPKASLWSYNGIEA